MIRPDPATTNDPSTDPAIQGNRPSQLTNHTSLLNPGEEVRSHSRRGRGPALTRTSQVHAQAGPHLPNSKVWANVEEPKTKEELAQRTKELNQ